MFPDRHGVMYDPFLKLPTCRIYDYDERKEVCHQFSTVESIELEMERYEKEVEMKRC